jgi:hypothetical protein
MWNLTPDYIQQVKEELKGRRDAIQARYADELKRLEADLEEIETLERVAYGFAAKHLPNPADEAPEPGSDASEVAVLQPSPAEPVAADAVPDGKGLSRWRLRLDAKSEGEPAES